VTRSAAVIVIAIALAAYGIYTALFLPAMLVGPPVPLLLLGFSLQAVLAIVAAVGVWTGRSWAGVAVVVLGVSIAATQLFEVILGIVPYLRAIAVAFLAIIGAVVMAAFIGRQSGAAGLSAQA